MQKIKIFLAGAIFAGAIIPQTFAQLIPSGTGNSGGLPTVSAGLPTINATGPNAWLKEGYQGLPVVSAGLPTINADMCMQHSGSITVDRSESQTVDITEYIPVLKNKSGEINFNNFDKNFFFPEIDKNSKIYKIFIEQGLPVGTHTIKGTFKEDATEENTPQILKTPLPQFAPTINDPRVLID